MSVNSPFEARKGLDRETSKDALLEQVLSPVTSDEKRPAGAKNGRFEWKVKDLGRRSTLISQSRVEQKHQDRLERKQTTRSLTEENPLSDEMFSAKEYISPRADASTRKPIGEQRELVDYESENSLQFERQEEDEQLLGMFSGEGSAFSLEATSVWKEKRNKLETANRVQAALGRDCLLNLLVPEETPDSVASKDIAIFSEAENRTHVNDAKGAEGVKNDQTPVNISETKERLQQRKSGRPIHKILAVPRKATESGTLKIRFFRKRRDIPTNFEL